MKRTANCIATILVNACLFVTAAFGTEAAVSLDQYNCGATSLYTVARLKGISVTWERVRAVIGQADRQHLHSFQDLDMAARACGLHAVALRASHPALEDLPLPAILQVKSPMALQPHFLVAIATRSDGAWILDPPHPHTFVHWPVLDKVWTGAVTLLLTEDELQAFEARQSKALLARHLFITGSAVASACLLLLVIGVLRKRRWAWPAPLEWSKMMTRVDAKKSPELPGGEFDIRRRWFRVGFAVVLSGCALGLAFARLGHIWTVPARLSVAREGRDVDLGELKRGSHKLTLPVTNSGGARLLFRAIDSSCSCVSAKGPTYVEPGETGQIRVEVNVSRGPGRATLRLNTSDPMGPTFITVAWFGAAKPVLIPSRVVERHACDTLFERIVDISYPTDPLTEVAPIVKSIQCDAPAIQVTSANGRPTDEAPEDRCSRQRLSSGVLSLVVRARRPATGRTLNGTAIIGVNYGNGEYTLRLPIHIEFAEAVTARPTGALFSAYTSSSLVGRKRAVHLTSEKEPSQFSVCYCPQFARCRILPLSDHSASLEIEIVARPEANAAEDIIIATGRPTRGEVHVRTMVFALADT